MDKMRYVFFSYIKGFEAGYEKGYTDFPRDYRDGDIYRIVDRGLYSIPLEELGLCNRTYNSLKCAGYRCIDDIASLHKERILAIRGMGKKSMDEVACALHQLAIFHTAWDEFRLPGP